ncbi:MAG TPA: sigma-70 family RNA polymerase sigma factor [Terriglobia bacterium]|nr:sigma-70 family RNA polymerase sigma factor [Terriglobia bacterium]
MGTPERPAGQRGTGESPEAADAKLVAAILRRDRKATAEFVGRYADVVYAYIHSRLTPRADLVEDLVQDVFLAAWKGLAGFQGVSSLEAWLLGIARHKVEDHYRSRLSAPDPLDEVDPDSRHVTLDSTLDALIDTARLNEKAARTLAALPEAYRVALLWRYWEKVPAREMAERSGKTEKAVERLLYRAREQFRLKWAGMA